MCNVPVWSSQIALGAQTSPSKNPPFPRLRQKKVFRHAERIEMIYKDVWRSIPAFGAILK